jgi:preprotein translocase subunit SecF
MNIEEEIRKIHERNKKVEMDKAWETSLARKILIAASTYFVMVLVMAALDMQHPLIGAAIPTLGFILSTSSIDFIKSVWMKKNMNPLIRQEKKR